ncbi:MAG TPA: hypothetical protein VNA13_02830 [Xanthomonadales bacterium]|nr:hypothetical protein [Xanthomonadales bacterium]
MSIEGKRGRHLRSVGPDFVPTPNVPSRNIAPLDGRSIPRIDSRRVLPPNIPTDIYPSELPIPTRREDHIGSKADIIIDSRRVSHPKPAEIVPTRKRKPPRVRSRGRRWSEAVATGVVGSVVVAGLGYATGSNRRVETVSAQVQEAPGAVVEIEEQTIPVNVLDLSKLSKLVTRIELDGNKVNKLVPISKEEIGGYEKRDEEFQMVLSGTGAGSSDSPSDGQMERDTDMVKVIDESGRPYYASGMNVEIENK